MKNSTNTRNNNPNRTESPSVSSANTTEQPKTANPTTINQITVHTLMMIPNFLPAFLNIIIPFPSDSSLCSSLC